jgi:hypothetical protein
MAWEADWAAASASISEMRSSSIVFLLMRPDLGVRLLARAEPNARGMRKIVRF